VALVQGAGPALEGPAIMVWAGDQATTHGHGWTRGVPGYDIDSRPFTGTVYPAITRKRSAGPISVSRTFVTILPFGSSQSGHRSNV